MQKENELLLHVKRNFDIKDLYILSKKDVGEVYLVKQESKKYILKIQRDLVNYERETRTLKLLNNKHFAAPVMLECGIIEAGSKAGYFIQEFWSGNTLLTLFPGYDFTKKEEIMYEVGLLLGKMNTLFTEMELHKSYLWKYAYDDVENFLDYQWLNVYEKRIDNWLEIINYRKYEDREFFRQSARIIKNAMRIVRNNYFMGLLHRDFGFRNIMIENDHVKGVIDFEYSIPGDIVFDLSKLIFNDLDFKKNKQLRNVFFAGWEKSAGQNVNWESLWLYLAIQGLGAVQWVDRQEDAEVRLENNDYRENGIFILKEACGRL